MSTPEEQARGRSREQIERELSEQHAADQEGEDAQKKKRPEDMCPEGFFYEAKKKAAYGQRDLISVCRMPLSYDLGTGFDHACHDCHYSYGRWLDSCKPNFVRNGCCTCTPICPEGWVMDFWKQDSAEKSNYVCLIPLDKVVDPLTDSSAFLV